MSVYFKEEDHSYHSTDTQENIRWTGVTTLISQFKQSFDPVLSSEKASKNPKSKWFGLSPENIRGHWKAETLRSIELGKWYHSQREKDITDLDTLRRDGIDLPIIRPLLQDGIKIAPDQNLTNGVYPEHFVYLKSAGICGQADRVEVFSRMVNVHDYKTNKELKTQGYKGWDGITQKMISPFSHLEDCHLLHYTLQLSIYLYIILKHNPTLLPGRLTIDHIIFETAGKDPFGNPVTKRDYNGDPIVKRVIPYEVSYMRSEVTLMIQWLQDNRDKLKTKI